MKKNARRLLLCVGFFILLAGLFSPGSIETSASKAPSSTNRVAPATLSGATIHVNTTDQGVTSGQCSLQEAIYSAEFGANPATGKAIALDQTDPMPIFC